MPKHSIVVFVLCLTVANISYAKPYAFITNQLDNSVSVIDTAEQKVINTVKISGKPAGVAVNVPKKQIYISTPEGGGSRFWMAKHSMSKNPLKWVARHWVSPPIKPVNESLWRIGMKIRSVCSIPPILKKYPY